MLSTRLLRAPLQKSRSSTLSVRSISPGVLHARDLSAAGARVYDPGYAHTLSCTSAITRIDGEAGVLRHRGYPIDQLAAHADFLQLAYLLIFGVLPTDAQLTEWKRELYAVNLPTSVKDVVLAFPTSAHPMAILQAALAALGAAHPELNPCLERDVYKSKRNRYSAIVHVLGNMPTLVAGIFRHCKGIFPAFVEGQARDDQDYAARFLSMALGEVDQRWVKAVEVLLLLHADHEQNCSTSTVRQLSSSGVDVFSCLSGGAAALYGPLHGGATEMVLKMFKEIGNRGNIRPYLDSVKRQEKKLMGFGHRVYRNYDPRAKIIRGMVYEMVGEGDELVQLAAELEREALKDSYFVERKLFPNCDFYSGVVYKAIGFEAEFFPVLFALGRCAGWLAHWLEFLDDPDRRIARPHQRYVGEIGPLNVPPIEEREEQRRHAARAKL